MRPARVGTLAGFTASRQLREIARKGQNADHGGPPQRGDGRFVGAFFVGMRNAIRLVVVAISGGPRRSVLADRWPPHRIATSRAAKWLSKSVLEKGMWAKSV